MPRKKTPSAPACADCAEPPSDRNAWLRAAGMLLVVLALYVAAKQLGLTGLSTHVEGAAGFGAIFTLGLLAATSSCLGTVGGLLLSVSAAWADGQERTGPWERLQPLLFFNAGRLGGYFLLGGLVGILGSSITLTPQLTGAATLAAALIMILLGLNVLRLVPKRFCRFPLPRAMQMRIRSLSHSRHPAAALLLGALTFFLPCGFTQSVQLLALASGSFLVGGTIMFVFALGTLPSLLGISLVGALAQGRFMRFFVSFAGATALLLGIVNVQSGLLVMGIDLRGVAAGILPANMAAVAQGNDPYVTVDEQGRQIISLYVSDQGYSPGSFTIGSGKETWVYAIAEKPVSGCANFITAPTYNLSTQVKMGGNWLGPIRDPQKDFVLTCSMGMLRADVRVRK